MNDHDSIQKSVMYIEANLNNNLTVNEIAEHVGYSAFHFCRIFKRTQKVTLMEYVRKRRMVQARKELLTNQKIIDIALDYGFQTASGFSKAFRKEFGYSPTFYIGRNNGLGMYENQFKLDADNIQPVFVKRRGFKIAGYGIETQIISGYTKDIAAYWDTYAGENLESKMYEQLNPPNHGEVGICIPSQDESYTTYLFGVIVNDYSKVTPDMMTIDVPAAEYAVFTTPPVNNVATAETYDKDPLSDAVKATWQYIFEDWFENNEYIYDETKIDFEYYDERCHGLENAVMDIYVPIKKK